MNPVRLIKRYKNRKLYDVLQKGYVTIPEVKAFVSKGENVLILDKETGEDLTSIILSKNTTNEDFDSDLIEKISQSDYKKLVDSVLKKETLDEDFNFVDLFCGAGGLSSGLEMAGFKCLFGNDANVHAINTFRKNHSSATSYSGSVAKVNETFLREKTQGKKVHLVVGGPPCQGFSTVGRGNPEDERNSLFNHYCRIVGILKPDFFIFENVTGLLAKKNEATLEAILKSFYDLGYKVIAKVLEAQHYGVPQKRKRTILLGTLLNKKLTFPSPKFETMVNGKYIPPRTVGDALNELAKAPRELTNNELKSADIKNETTKERLKFIPEGKGIRYKEDEDKFLPNHLKLGVDWENIREGRLRELCLYRLDRSLPSPTIMTMNHNYYHPVENRRFTARELATLQGFPTDYEFVGKFSSQHRQIGNAVPPLMAKALGEKILEIYKSPDLDLSEANAKNDELISISKIRMGAFTYSSSSHNLEV